MRRAAYVFLAAALMAIALPAAAISPTPSKVDPPIISWQPPPSWSGAPAGQPAYSGSGSARTALTDISSPLPFIAVAACRQYDSRSTSALPDNTPRAVTLSGAPCGIPTGAQSVAVNITVFSITGAGSNGVFKVGNASPPTTAWINYPPTETQRGNAGVVSVAANAVLWVQVNQGAGSVQFTVDVFGYYANAPATSTNFFSLTTAASGWGTVTGTNTSSAAMSSGILGLATNTNLTSAGVVGYNYAAGTGVWGWNASTGRGVYGLSAGGPGVWGESNTGTGEGVHGKSAGGVGVLGESTAGAAAAVLGVNNTATNATQGVGGYAGGAARVFGVQGQIGSAGTAESAGVHGIGAATAARSYGVFGENLSGANASAGVRGITNGGTTNSPSGNIPCGVRGEGNTGQTGVQGVSNYVGVHAANINPVGGATRALATLAYCPSATCYAVYAEIGDFAGTGAKYFVEPHAQDPSRVIRYISLEGPESGTYFRGKARTQGGVAIIEVPDHFRMVSDTEGMTVHVTPVGQFAETFVESADLNSIVIRSSRDVEFNYIVHGVRRAFRDFTPISPSQEFMPQTPADTLSPGLPAEIRARLVQIGIYNPDGTVNMRTAERLGWDRVWAARGIAVK